MKLVIFSFLFCGVFAHNHDVKNGVKIGEMSIFETKCPVWIVSYNIFSLDCRLNIDDLKFKLDSTMLDLDVENGKTLLKLPETTSIPEDRKYTLTATSKNTMIGTLMAPMKKIPRPTVLNELSRLNYGVSSGNVSIINAKTLFLPNFYYNGKAPDAFFWIGKGRPSSQGWKIPDENGMEKKLGEYRGQALILKLPNDETVETIDYLSVWCREYSIDFGHVIIPKDIMVPPTTFMPQVMDYSKLEISPLVSASDSENVILKDDPSLLTRRQGESRGTSQGSENGQETLSYSKFLILTGLLCLIFKY